MARVAAKHICATLIASLVSQGARPWMVAPMYDSAKLAAMAAPAATTACPGVTWPSAKASAEKSTAAARPAAVPSRLTAPSVPGSTLGGAMRAGGCATWAGAGARGLGTLAIRRAQLAHAAGGPRLPRHPHLLNVVTKYGVLPNALPSSLLTVSDSLLVRLATNPRRQGASVPVASATQAHAMAAAG